MVNSCTFCAILAGELPSTIVFQDEVCIAIMDIQPVNPGHLLLITREHYTGFKDLPPEICSQLFITAQKLAEAVRQSGIPCEGITLLLADGTAAGQQVPHIHLHIIPRFQGDSFGFQFSPRYAELPTRDELENNAYYIRQAMENPPAA
jgi:histidine triad (HIT) family protein